MNHTAVHVRKVAFYNGMIYSRYSYRSLHVILENLSVAYTLIQSLLPRYRLTHPSLN